jgi:tRNA dimethylallyltransferase
MDIGTAKPTPAERAALAHHLIDIKNPDEAYDSGEFVERADALCQEIHARGALPVISGGTAFYVKNFMLGMPEAPKADAEVRKRVEADFISRGPDALREELEAIDPESAIRIARADHYRLKRALEVVRQTGRPRASFRQSVRPRDAYRFMAVELVRPVDELARRIETRVEKMFLSGLADEVEGLIRLGYGKDSPGMRAIGYSEFFDRDPGATLDDVKRRIVVDTRRYAKRQRTFFRALPEVRRIGAEDFDTLASLVSELLATA